MLQQSADLEALNAITLGRGLLFQPLLGALIYLWARENSASSVNILGLISVPARGQYFRLHV